MKDRNGWRALSVGALLGVLMGCGGEGASYEASAFGGDPDLDSIYAYNSPDLKPALERCVVAYKQNQSCSLDSIRPIGTEVIGDVSLSDIEARLVVSHSWMAENFMAALREIDDQDFLNVFKPLNAIVISDDIIPSFYHPMTASMYIDPRYLWQSEHEWRTIAEKDDFRADYASVLSYRDASRFVDAQSFEYVQNGHHYDAQLLPSRSSAYLAPRLFGLLVHELAHANDYLPPETLTQIGQSGTVLRVIEQGSPVHESLTARQPLTSSLLKAVAQVSFWNDAKYKTEQVLSSTGYQAGEAFELDGAAYFYGYSTAAEDVATLFENYMMYKKYHAILDVAFVRIPQHEDPSCDDWKVAWGQRNRLADPEVQQRTAYVAARLLGQSEAAIYAQLSELTQSVEPIASGLGWCESQAVVSKTERMGPSYPHSQRYLADFSRQP